jgi:hypothetical protein
MSPSDSSATPPSEPSPRMSDDGRLNASATGEGRATNDFAAAADTAPPTLIREFIDFLREYRLWWLTPLVVVLLLLTGLVFLGGTAAAPFIYPIW